MNINSSLLEQLAGQLGDVLQARQLKLVTVESCTGGMVAQAITRIAGCSAWFEQGFIPYSNAAKQTMLGVKTESVQTFGAVSQEVVREMAEGALLRAEADCSLAITGIAGPGGAGLDKPVGTVWFALAMRGSASVAPRIETLKQHFRGNRDEIRLQATQFVLEKMREFVAVQV